MTTDYREIIRSEIEARTKRNPAYSMRSFARAAGLKAPHLSGVLNGSKGLSATSALRVAKALGLSEDESEEFIDLVHLRHARRQSDKTSAKERLAATYGARSFHLMNDDQVKLASQWHHFAIRHLVELEDFQPCAKWIARRLGLPEKEVRESLRLLDALKLIDMSGPKWKINQGFLATPNISSRAIRNNHHQVLRLAGLALETQSIEERDFSTLFMAIKKESVREAKKWLKDFRRQFCQKLDREQIKDALYCLSIQFFEITPIRKGE